ncbi:MAG: hypothetical protein ABI430_01535 [Candidatus Taylorbacteria bacterium]
MKKYKSNRLFAEPSFFEGVASVVDLGAVIHKDYNFSETGVEADHKALQNDWRAVGDDIRNSISKYEQHLAESTK